MLENELFFDSACDSIKQLIQKDPKLKLLFQQIGPYKLKVEVDYYASLSRIIVGQQLSIKAATSIWNNLNNLCDGVSPERVYGKTNEELRSAGLSKAKAAYLINFTDIVLNGEIDFNKLKYLPNEAAIKRLKNIKGVGRWTAETFLIFSFGRLNLLPECDAGLKRAIKWLYELDVHPDKQVMAELDARWEPYQGIVALYLWEAVNCNYIATRSAI